MESGSIPMPGKNFLKCEQDMARITPMKVRYCLNINLALENEKNKTPNFQDTKPHSTPTIQIFQQHQIR